MQKIFHEIRRHRFLLARKLIFTSMSFSDRVMCYIKYGWDELLVDPDKGKNCRQKLAKTHYPSSVGVRLFQSVPNVQDAQWTNKLRI